MNNNNNNVDNVQTSHKNEVNIFWNQQQKTANPPPTIQRTSLSVIIKKGTRILMYVAI
jgi:hypothetical protein